MPLRTKLLLSLVLIALVPLSLFGFTAFRTATVSLMAVEHTDLEDTVDSVDRALADLEKNQADTTFDNATWDEIHAQAAMDTGDPQWFSVNFGPESPTSITNTFGLDILGVWNYANKNIYSIGPAEQMAVVVGSLVKQAPTSSGHLATLANIDQDVYIVSVAPIRTSDGKDPNGILLAGHKLAMSDLTQIKALTGYDVALYKGQNAIATTQSATVTPAPAALDSAANGEKVFDQNDPNVALAYSPITGSDGKPIATVIVWRSRAASAAAQTSIAETLAVGFAVGAILAIIVAILLGRSITRPLLEVANTADKIAGGDLSQRITVASRDELGRLASAFNQMAAKLGERVVVSEQENVRLQALDEYRQGLISSIAHTFDTPVHMIRTHSEALGFEQYGSLNEAQQRSVMAIRRAISVEEAMLSDLQDFSHAQQRSLQIMRERLSLNEIVQEAAMTVKERYGDKQVQFVAVIPRELPMIFADRIRIEQILQTLIGWAFDFTIAGGRVEVRAAERTGQVAVAISDTSIGLAPSEQSKIFSLFYQPPVTTPRGEGNTSNGNGLGLALTKALVEYQGGTIGLEVQQGRGNTFTFTVPSTT